MSRLNRELVLGVALGVVVLWFGVQEVMSPADWIGYVPAFLGSGGMLNNLVVVHGILLIVCGIGMVFNFYRRVAAAIVAVMLLNIIGTLFLSGGIDAIVVRDFGLFGMAVALAMRN